MSNVIVVGGGAAGMMAAVFAARNGQNVQLLEKNEKRCSLQEKDAAI